MDKNNSPKKLGCLNACRFNQSGPRISGNEIACSRNCRNEQDLHAIIAEKVHATCFYFKPIVDQGQAAA